jgi:hypothetical protein
MIRCTGILLLAGLLGACGCQPAHPPLETLVSVEQVVAEYNANAARIPRLWARAEISFQQDAVSPSMNVDGLLALQKGSSSGPQDFFLKFNEAGQEIGRTGVSLRDKAYYLWFHAGQRRQCLWGRLDLAGAPGVEALPIDPTQLLSVLAVCELPTDVSAPPCVAQTICFDPCAYVLTFIDRQPVTGKLLLKRQVYFRWSLTEPRRPFRVDLLDDRGVTVLTAYMEGHQPIQREDTPPADRPVVPTDIRLHWLQSGATLRLRLRDLTTEDKVDPEAFLFWQRLPGGLSDVAEQVDRNADGKGANGL